MMAKKKIPTEVVVAAITGLVIIECVAMSQGINGTVRSIIIAVIAGLAGFTLPQLKIK